MLIMPKRNFWEYSGTPTGTRINLLSTGTQSLQCLNWIGSWEVKTLNGGLINPLGPLSQGKHLSVVSMKLHIAICVHSSKNLLYFFFHEVIIIEGVTDAYK